MTLSDLIDEAFEKRLKRAEDNDAEGHPLMSHAEFTKIVEQAIAWEEVKRKPDAPKGEGEWGSALRRSAGE